jgi:integrase
LVEVDMTRYPRGQKGAKWTVKQLQAVPPEWKGDTLSDGQGLSGEVRVNSGQVSVVFKFAFKWHGKVSWHYCGTFPHADLADIRAERDHARELVQSGVDPRLQKVADRIEAQTAVEALVRAEEQRQSETLTFKDLYDVWIKDGVARADDNKYLIQSFNKHALPALASIEIRELSEHHLRSLYRSIISSGRVATAYELSKDIGQMLRWAEKRKPWRPLLIEGNPAELVEVGKLLPKDYQRERDRVLTPDEIRRLHQIFVEQAQRYAAAENKYEAERPLKKEVQIAIWLCLSTLCRIGELLMTEWAHVNFDERVWIIPAVNTKGQRGKRSQQIVYLSDFALKQFKELHALTGDTPWAFPARYKQGHVCVKSASKQIGDRQMKFKSRTKKLRYRVENDSLVLGDQEWTPHDLRRTGATMMQKLKVGRDVINLCQNHVIGSKVDKHYLHHDFAEEKMEAWSRLGKWIDSVLA